jgi:hypothetical protein
VCGPLRDVQLNTELRGLLDRVSFRVMEVGYGLGCGLCVDTRECGSLGISGNSQNTLMRENGAASVESLSSLNAY